MVKRKDRDHLHCCSFGEPHDKHETVTGSNDGPCLSLISNLCLSRDYRRQSSNETQHRESVTQENQWEAFYRGHFPPGHLTLPRSPELSNTLAAHETKKVQFFWSRWPRLGCLLSVVQEMHAWFGYWQKFREPDTGSFNTSLAMFSGAQAKLQCPETLQYLAIQREQCTPPETWVEECLRVKPVRLIFKCTTAFGMFLKSTYPQP